LLYGPWSVCGIDQLHGHLALHVIRAVGADVVFRCSIEAEPLDLVRALGIGFSGAGCIDNKILSALVIPGGSVIDWSAGAIGQGLVLGPLQPALCRVVGSDALVGQGGGPGLDLEHGNHEGTQQAEHHDDEDGLDQGEACIHTGFIPGGSFQGMLVQVWVQGVPAILARVSHKSGEVLDVDLVQEADGLALVRESQF